MDYPTTLQHRETVKMRVFTVFCIYFFGTMPDAQIVVFVIRFQNTTWTSLGKTKAKVTVANEVRPGKMFPDRFLKHCFVMLLGNPFIKCNYFGRILCCFQVVYECVLSYWILLSYLIYLLYTTINMSAGVRILGIGANFGFTYYFRSKTNYGSSL